MLHEDYREGLRKIRTLNGRLIGEHLKGVDGSLVIPRGSSSDIRIEISPKVGKAGRQQGRARLFTFTSKMRAASYSIPAGPPALGGTCRSAAHGARSSAPDEFICHGCYAIGGRYGETCGVVQISQAIRAAWTLAALKNNIFADEMIRALKHLQRTAKVDPYKNPVNHSFFRLHDCGDLGLSTHGYYEAWCDIAEAFPRTMFWAPTREWASGADWWIKRRPPENFVVRPSALHVFDDPPRVSGLAAGSTASLGAVNADWDCQAYRGKNDHNCESVPGMNGRKPCRVCWTHPDVVVNYTPHGGLKSALKKIGKWPKEERMAKKNPGADLSELFEQYSEIRSNPPKEFEAWLLSRGIDPNAWNEDRWLRHLMEDRGMDFDEAVAALESTAEYQM